MPISIPGRVVVFDYGEVISREPSERDRAELVSAAGVADSAFWGPYWAHRQALDQGTIGIVEYWNRVGAELGVEFSAARVQQLWVADFTGWISIDPVTFEVIADLHEGGTRLALLSNAGFDFASPFRRSPLGAYFERVFVSAELGMIKPDPAIYRAVLHELGISAAEMVFIDNKRENIAGAESLGIRGHVFVSGAGLRSFLESLQSPESR